MKAIRSSSVLASQYSAATYARAAITARNSTLSSQTRTFIPNLFGANSPQKLTASRILPYDSKTLYQIISDVSSYHHFLPFCLSSTVTKFSSPDKDGKTWPEEAELVVGFTSDIKESFWSRVYCAPDSYIVEAVSGQTNTDIDPDMITHHSARDANDKARNEAVLTHLKTRWSLKPFPYKPGPISSNESPRDHTSPAPSREQTQISLVIDYQFANPIYSALSATAAPKVADKMITAFETRVKNVLDKPSSTGTSS